MSDLIERLRSGDASWELREKAADALEAKDAEIERLKAVVDAARELVSILTNQSKLTLDSGYWNLRHALDALETDDG